jgi:neutral ceramidase
MSRVDGVRAGSGSEVEEPRTDSVPCFISRVRLTFGPSHLATANLIGDVRASGPGQETSVPKHVSTEATEEQFHVVSGRRAADRVRVMTASWPDARITKDRFTFTLPAPSEPDLPFVDGGLLAGAAEVDLTPPPGMPKAGHSRQGHDGNGFRTRIKARVIHLRQGRTSLALLACDLHAGSAVIHHALARAVADTDVPLSGLLMTATHTHAGPGQYCGCEQYNQWASNRPGFDPDYSGFVVEQLAAAVRSAVATRRPAKAAFGSTEVWGFTRNRSHGAHVQNANVADKRVEPQRRYATIDPNLHLLRVDDENGPMAAFTWFSIHGTGISKDDASYNADLWAYLNGELRHRLGPIVSGAAVATHGDMTPAVRPGMLVFPEAERIGRGIGKAAAELYASLTPSADITLGAALREVDLTQRPKIDGIVLPEPRIGLTALGGATENESALVRLPFVRPGSARRRPHPEQGVRRTLKVRVNQDPAKGPVGAFPQVIPFHLVRIGDVRILGVPFEVTVEAGRRIASAVGGHTVVSSLTNDYCQYLTTEEEYAAQYYEGGSTVFGPKQQAWVAAIARELSAAVGDGHTEEVAERTFDFSVRRYAAQPTGTRVARRLAQPRYVEATPTEDAYWELEWLDVPPGDLAWHEPIVRVEDEDGHVVADDQGWYLGVTHLGQSRYAARWYAPPVGRPGKHRFVLEANSGQPETPSQDFD